MSNKFSFAHLLGRSASAKVEEDDEKEESKKSKARKAENEEDKKDAEEDDTDAKEDEKDDPDAEEDDDEKDAEDDDDGDDEDDSKAKKPGVVLNVSVAQNLRQQVCRGKSGAGRLPGVQYRHEFESSDPGDGLIRHISRAGARHARSAHGVGQNHQLGVDAKPVDKSAKRGWLQA